MRFILFFVILVFTIPAYADPCPCYPANDELADKAYRKADIIIKARVLNPSRGFTQAGPILSVKTLDLIKGEFAPDEINMNYNNLPAACGHHFERDDEAILALYDTRELSRTSLARGYGYRLMDRCNLAYVRHYLGNNQIQLNQTPNNHETE